MFVRKCVHEQILCYNALEAHCQRKTAQSALGFPLCVWCTPMTENALLLLRQLCVSMHKLAQKYKGPHVVCFNLCQQLMYRQGVGR